MNFTTILNLPIFVSQPHFLNTRPDLSLGVLGLKPSAVLHDTYVDVEPMTGASLNAAKRLMFSTVLNDWWPTLSSSRASSQAPSRQAREARELFFARNRANARLWGKEKKNHQILPFFRRPPTTLGCLWSRIGFLLLWGDIRVIPSCWPFRLGRSAGHGKREYLLPRGGIQGAIWVILMALLAFANALWRRINPPSHCAARLELGQGLHYGKARITARPVLRQGPHYGKARITARPALRQGLQCEAGCDPTSPH
jgi:hypothetical protein